MKLIRAQPARIRQIFHRRDTAVRHSDSHETARDSAVRTRPEVSVFCAFWHSQACASRINSVFPAIVHTIQISASFSHSPSAATHSEIIPAFISPTPITERPARKPVKHAAVVSKFACGLWLLLRRLEPAMAVQFCLLLLLLVR